MAFFKEFPFTRTYDSDLAWLIRRMKEVLARMDSVEERMAALEELVTNFIATLNIDQLIKDELTRQIRELIESGEINTFLLPLLNKFNEYTVCWTNDPDFYIAPREPEYIEMPSNSAKESYCTIAGGYAQITISSFGFGVKAVPSNLRQVFIFKNTDPEYLSQRFGFRFPSLQQREIKTMANIAEGLISVNFSTLPTDVTVDGITYKQGCLIYGLSVSGVPAGGARYGSIPTVFIPIERTSLT